MQSTHKAVRACKLFRLHGKPYPRTIVALMQTTYKQEAVGMGRPKNASLPFVQSTHKAVRACKLFLLLHRRIVSAMEIRVNSLQTRARTIVALMQTTYEQEAVGMGRPKTQPLRLCNQRTKRYELANCSSCTIAA